MSYTIIVNRGVVIDDRTGVQVAPCQSAEDPAFLAYQDWANGGNPVTEVYADEPPAPIQEVTPRQIRLALNEIGMRAAIEAAVAASSQDTRDTWEFSTIVQRNNPLIAGMAGALGLSDADIDNLFALAATK